jgi:hypothetical protein
MLLSRRRSQVAASLTIIAMFGGVSLSLGSRVEAPSIPERLGDDVFWRMVSDYSEPGGFFRSDNFVSNEITFQWVLPELARTTKTGGVYMGVGPDQNFTYIVTMQPKIAFIVDIRRQNMLHHLLYKALIELSPDRAEFLSRLFSRPRPGGLDASGGPAALFQAYANVPADTALYSRNLAAVKEQLVARHKFGLTSDDLRTIEYVYSAFFTAGPDLTYSFTMPGRNASMMFYGRRMPTYAELMPLVGDFAGDKAIRAVGQYVRDHGATVTAFYTSNVEQYLFQSDDWKKFFGNVATLPVDTSSTFIRAVFNFTTMPSQTGTPGPRSRTMLASIADQVQAFTEGRIQSYWDVIQTSR